MHLKLYVVQPILWSFNFLLRSLYTLKSFELFIYSQLYLYYTTLEKLLLNYSHTLNSILLTIIIRTIVKNLLTSVTSNIIIHI